jgi:hypothetical protein
MNHPGKRFPPLDQKYRYGNLFRCDSCRRLARSDPRSGKGRLLQALTSDFAPCINSACYRRYRLQQLGRILKPPPGILLEKHLKENNDWLWNSSEQVEW